MIPRFDSERFEAFERLLAEPDPADLPTRAHAYRCAGDPARRATRLPAILMAWLQRRHLAVDVEQRLAPASRAGTRRPRPANLGLRVLRPTGTG
jgi:hypothetical protein